MNKRVKILIIAFFITCFFATISDAAIEIKPGTNAHTNISISEAYEYCFKLRENSNTSTLGDNKLDPHLSLNKDWGAVAYLSYSGYGKVRSSSAPTVSINSRSYTTTTGNKTGVLDLGKSNTFTSSFVDLETYNNGYYLENRINLLNNKDTKYVEELAEDCATNEDTTKGMALAETKNFDTFDSNLGRLPCFCRFSICGIRASSNNCSWTGAEGGTTFRPVIWN